MVELEKRLRTRAQDSDEVIAKRMSKSENEISHWPEYDYAAASAMVGWICEKPYDGCVSD